MLRSLAGCCQMSDHVVVSADIANADRFLGFNFKSWCWFKRDKRDLIAFADEYHSSIFVSGNHVYRYAAVFIWKRDTSSWFFAGDFCPGNSFGGWCGEKNFSSAIGHSGSESEIVVYDNCKA